MSKYNVLGLGGTAISNGRSDSPFFAMLTDDGTDDTLNEDYSAGAVDAYWQAPVDSVINLLTIVGGIESLGQGVGLSTTFLGGTALTNGLKFAVKDGSGNIVQDLSVTWSLKNTRDIGLFSTSSSFALGLASTTAANNEFVAVFYVHFPTGFGGSLFIPRGYRFVCTLQDNLSVIPAFGMSVSGRYV